MDIRNKIFQGNSLEQLKTFPDSSVDMAITSPPYWGLRDYDNEPVIWDDWEGSLGDEPSMTLFIKHLCDIFDETKRVLKDHGTLWVNLGDSYISSGGVTKPEHLEGAKVGYTRNGVQRRAGRDSMLNLPNKSLGLIPHRFAIAMVERGWICRNTIIWKKNNVLPQSMKDRFTVDFEYIFFFAKKPKYYFEQIFEQSKDTESYEGRRPRNVGKMNKYDAENYAMQHDGEKLAGEGKKYPERNKRSVWEINTHSFRDAHFAVFPEELVETPILAGCPEYVCKECGKPKVKEWEKLDDVELRDGYITNRKLIGYKETCKCNADFESGIVLDMFMGSGTTALVAMKNARDYVGIELNQEYIDIAKNRLDPYVNVRLDEFTKLYKTED